VGGGGCVSDMKQLIVVMLRSKWFRVVGCLHAILSCMHVIMLPMCFLITLLMNICLLSLID
jgi:hypothetical protein